MMMMMMISSCDDYLYLNADMWIGNALPVNYKARLFNKLNQDKDHAVPCLSQQAKQGAVVSSLALAL